MSQIPKRRGRPKGSEIDDSVMLRAIADRLWADPALKATTAMRRIKRNATDAEIRRWQSKWKERQAALLSDAEGRATNSEAAMRVSASLASQRTGIHNLIAAARGTTRWMETPEMRALREFQSSPVMRVMRELQNSPAYRLKRELENNPMMRILKRQREMQDNIRRLCGF